MLCLFLQRQCARSTRVRWSPSTNKPDNKSVGSSITSCHQSTARTKTRKFTTGDISWKSALTSRLISFTIREKECNCLCAKPNKTPIRLLAYRTGAIFFCAFFRRTKHEAGIPSPVVRVSRVSRAHRSQHEMLPFAGLKNVKKRHQFCRLSENKLLIQIPLVFG